MTGQKISVVIADDHDIFCEGLSQLLREEAAIDFMGIARNGHALIDLVHELRPEIGVMDVSMPGPGAEEIARSLTRDVPETRLIALTVHAEPYIAQHLLAAGVLGYVIKNNAFRDLIEAVHVVSDGGQYLSREISEKLVASEMPNKLSNRERACLNAAALGAMSAQIAHQLGISERTVDFHVTNAMRKLDANHRTEAVAKAVRLGLLDL